MATLVIMAAGLGSRYGSTKQLEYVTENRETIIDFSVYDAIKSGFTAVVFIVRPEILDVVKSEFEAKLKPYVTTHFVCQTVSNLPKPYLPKKRVKPWGTGHALLCASTAVTTNFCVINADDFYGRDAYKLAFNSLKNVTKSTYGLIGYVLENTLSENGTVSRGLCDLNANNDLVMIDEKTAVKKQGTKIINNLKNNTQEVLNPKALVSMNMWVFTPDIFNHLEMEFKLFLESYISESNSEFYIPTAIQNGIQNSKFNVFVKPTESEWFGMTYKADRTTVASNIQALKATKQYPESLWSN